MQINEWLQFLISISYKAINLESITLNSSNGYIKFHLNDILGFPNETCYYGGYDILGEIEIKCDNYFVKGSLNLSTGNIFNFYIHYFEKITWVVNHLMI